MAAVSRQALGHSFERLSSVGSLKIVLELPKAYVPLQSDPSGDRMDNKNAQQQKYSAPKNKSFNLHVGGVLTIPSVDAKAKPQYTQPHKNQRGTDPFAGLPFLAFAEKMGERVMPAIEAAREQQRMAATEGRTAAQLSQPVVPTVPHFLPFTRWAAHNESFRDTFIENPADRKKARLSWYHPDDTMVPRDWFKNGLLADLAYYAPFGLGKKYATQ